MDEKARALSEKIIETVVVKDDGTVTLTEAFPAVAREIITVRDDTTRAQLRADIMKLHDMLIEEGAKECALKLGRLAAQLRPRGVGAMQSAPKLNANMQLVGVARERIATFRKGLRPLGPAGASLKRPPVKPG